MSKPHHIISFGQKQNFSKPRGGHDFTLCSGSCARSFFVETLDSTSGSLLNRVISGLPDDAKADEDGGRSRGVANDSRGLGQHTYA